MSDRRFAGVMFVIAAAGLLITFGMHPNDRAMFSPDTYEAAARKLTAVHSLGLLTIPFWFIGALGLSRETSASGRGSNLATSALVFYGFGLIAMMVGVVCDGLVSPGIAAKFVLTPDGAAALPWKVVFNYNGMLDMAFMKVMLVATAIGLLLWSLAVWCSSALPRAFAVFGGLLSVLTIGAMLTGQIMSNPHLFGIVLVGQILWFGAAGIVLLSKPRVAA